MDISKKDYLDIARGRYTEQFSAADNFDHVVNVWTGGKTELQDSMLRLLTIPDIDLSSGVQLDVIGNIVGQPRELFEVASTIFFGFSEDSTSQKFGSTENTQGGLYYSLGDPLSGIVRLNDAVYRKFIKAKIIQNNSNGNAEDIIAACELIFDTDYVEVIDGDDANLWVSIGRPWNDPEETSFSGFDETEIAKRLIPVSSGVTLHFPDYSSKEAAASVQSWIQSSYLLHNTANTVFAQTIE